MKNINWEGMGLWFQDKFASLNLDWDMRSAVLVLIGGSVLLLFLNAIGRGFGRLFGRK